VHEARAWGGLFGGSGAPDYLQAHPVRALSLAPLNLLNLTLKARKVSTSAPYTPRVAHWLIPSLFTLDHAHLAHAHGGDVALLERLPQGGRLARALMRRVSVINFVSDDLHRRFEALLNAPITRFGVAARVTPMGVSEAEPCERFRATLRALKAREGAPLMMCTVGRLTPIKGLDVLLEAFSLMSEGLRSQLLWCVAGDGPERDRVAHEARQRGLKVSLLGQLPPSQRDALLSEADVFALPSRQLGRRVEGSPVALMEALASGCAVVASETGGVSGLLTQAPSALSPLIRGAQQGDAHSFATQLTSLIHLLSSLTREEREARREALRAFGGRWLWSSLRAPHLEALYTALGQQAL
jgi:glycosyltransferase involved in cell wall biosynthesis